MECSSIKLNSLLRAKRESEMVLAPVRGVRALLRWAKFSFDIKREQLALMKKRSGPRGAQSHLTERENCPAPPARDAVNQ